MMRLMLVAHAPLASAFKAVAAHLPMDTTRVDVCDVLPDELPEGVARRLKRALGEEPALLLCDVPGATPFNGACLLARTRHARVRVVAGLNVPMLWRVLWSMDQPLDAVAQLASERAVLGVDACPEDSGRIE